MTLTCYIISRAEILASVDASQPPRRLILDSGATAHVVGGQKHPEGLSNFIKTQGSQTARRFDQSIVRYAGIGTIQTKRFSITEVYHIEGLAENLICVSQLEVQ